MSKKLKIGITQGDINGISIEVILKAFNDPRFYEDDIFIVYGSPKVIAYYKKNFELNFPHQTISKVEQAKAKIINIINCNSEDIKVEMGESTEIAGLAAYQALEKACADIKDGHIDVLVTGPINKKNIQAAGFNFPGHTEYLSKKFSDGDNLMILMNDQIKIGIITNHVPIAQIPSVLTKELILKKIKIFNDSLKSDFGISKPKIAILSLNPHCGDEGLLGQEEQTIIIPAIKEAVSKNIMAFGPYPADGFFGAMKFRDFDGVLAMYHDQGLAPFKIIAFEDGVNFTAGLSIIRTSPAHGTAYDIAGKGIANEQSFRNAVYVAKDIYFNRNALQILEIQRVNLEALKKDIEEINKNGE
jgi:4-hydroxythreonine-4-phosphate dehydrogenase